MNIWYRLRYIIEQAQVKSESYMIIIMVCCTYIITLMMLLSVDLAPKLIFLVSILYIYSGADLGWCIKPFLCVIRHAVVLPVQI